MTDTRRSKPLECICGGRDLEMIFSYDKPLPIEVQLKLPEGVPYRRHYKVCKFCGHFIGFHDFDLSSLYEEAYVNGTYGGSEGVRQTFLKIIGLPKEKSDNAGRVKRINEYAQKHYGQDWRGRLLDVGSGLGVFPYAMKNTGWDCVALDPDERSIENIKQNAGVEGVQGDFLKIDYVNLGRFDAITFNKVLEHVEHPVAMLSRAKNLLKQSGFVYAEVPDVAAASEGKTREEFGVDHYHVFSPASLAMMCERAGLSISEIERVREPSTKFTLRAFCTL